MVPAMIGVESVSICSGLLLLSLGPELLPFGPVPFCTSTGKSTSMDMTSSVCQVAAKRAKNDQVCFNSLPGWCSVGQAIAQQHALTSQPQIRSSTDYTQAVSDASGQAESK